MAVDFLEEKRAEIVARLKELRPLVDEYRRLEAAATALDGVAALPAAPRAAARRSSARAAISSKSTGSKSTGSESAPRRGRPKGSGKRRDQALAFVRATPGITVRDIAEKMGINRNYLYRMLPNLAAEGLLIKDGSGWYPMPT